MSSMITGSILPLKPPKTFEEQLDILHQHGLIIDDPARALIILSKVNYYRFSAYLLPFKSVDVKTYHSSPTFSNIYKISLALRKV